MLALLVLVWSITPALPRVNAASAGAPSFHAAPTAPAILVTEGHRGTLVTDDSSADSDRSSGFGPALSSSAEAPAHAQPGPFIAPAHPAGVRLSRTLHIAGRAPPRA